MNKSQRLVAAIQKLEPFQPTRHAGRAIHALTGAEVTAIPPQEDDDDEYADAFVNVCFPGRDPVTMNGLLYLDLLVRESVGMEKARDDARVKSLYAHLVGKHELE